MSDFTSDREELARLREHAAKAENHAEAARARAEKAEETRRDFARRARRHDASDVRRLGELTAATDAARTEAKAAADVARRTSAALFDRLGVFTAQYDPRRAVTHLDDGVPLLLFPLRVETRFKRTGGAEELWVRVYPDDCLVDSFEPLLADAERAAGQKFRTRWLAAGGVETEQRAAWRDLVASVGSSRATWIARELVLTDTDQPAEDDMNEIGGAVPTTSQTWNRAPVVRALPERLVLRAELAGEPPVEVLGNAILSPLAVGPDPHAPEGEQLAQANGVLSVPEPIRWMVDFERAVEIGMGFKVPLTAAQAATGFDRLMILGVRLTSDASDSAAVLGELVAHHRFGATGFAIVPQGTPTNNTESASAGHDRRDDPEASFDATFRARHVPHTAVWEERLDGQWLSDLLGVAPDVIEGVEHSMGSDQIVARAMNTALWPATLGYALETLMHPVFSDDTVDALRWFHTRFVSGRGWLPAVRVGNQPYGILPTSAMRRWRWLSDRLTVNLDGSNAPAGAAPLLMPLLRTLTAMERSWDAIASNTAAVGRAGDPHQILLDILGLHPTSVEFHQRFAQSVDSIRARLRLFGDRRGAATVLDAAAWQDDARRLLRELGYSGARDPDILAQVFHGAQQLLGGPLIDDRELSEHDTIRAYTGDGRNYLRWLIDAARVSLEELRTERGFPADGAPTALLYLLLRHALILGYWETSVRLNASAGVLDATAVSAARRESPFVHVAADARASESRWAMLYTDEPRVTGVTGRLVSDHITNILGSVATRDLDEQLRALESLERVPTAKLERAFVEHIDCASYRLDAWVQGMIQLQLAVMRYGGNSSVEGEARRGVYLGAFGWLEDVRPLSRLDEGVELPDDIADFFSPSGAPPLTRDATNEGYMFAPSLNQAVTAAVLRSGYLANATEAAPTPLGVNLSSARVRVAQQILEGIRNGQSLGALLGYRFERGLHDRHGMAEVDRFVFALRTQFPLRAERLEATRTPPGTAIETIEARNVVDGELLIDHVRRTHDPHYPFGLTLPPASLEQSAAIDAEFDALLDAHDAVADVALAESVHQAAQGNFDRAAANLDAYSKGGLPPDPDVARTPSGGITLTHRVAVHLPANATHVASPVPGVAMTPRAECEPRVNAWLASLLPASPEDVYCRVHVTNAVGGTSTVMEVTQRDLTLQPLDLLQCVVDAADQGMGELDDRVIHHVSQSLSLRPDAVISIRFTELDADRSRVSFFELAPLLRALRSLVGRARPLRPSDLAVAGEGVTAGDASMNIDPARVSDTRTRLEQARAVLMPIATTLLNRLDDVATNRALLLSTVDSTVESAANAAATLMAFGIRAPVGEWYASRASITARMVALIKKRVVRWTERHNAAVTRLAAYDVLPLAIPDAQRFDELESIQRLVAAQAVVPRPALLTLARTQAGDAVDAFQMRLASLAAAAVATVPTLAALRAAVSAQVPLDAFDVEPFSLKQLDDDVLHALGELSSALTAIIAEVDQRLATSQQAISDASAATDARARVQALTRGAKAIFGEDFTIVPFFEVPAAARGELANAVDHSISGELLRFQLEQRGDREPVDTWLYGLARVRETMHLWEHIAVHAEAFGAPTPVLMPLQLPATPAISWLALEYPEPTVIDGERLCYTAHFARPFDAASPQCGILLDEWPEVLPANDQTAAVAFHFNRPNAEPPQVWLLATPSGFGEGWAWDDVVDSVREAFERARRRAVEPGQLDATPYARFLPAAVTATTVYPVAIATNLARNNGLLHALAEDPNA